MSFDYGYGSYVTVSERIAKADRIIEKLKKSKKDPDPVLLSGRTLADTWWGKAWNKNLESYADYANRIGRGKSYVKNHAVVDLKISGREASALVVGSASKPYSVRIVIDPLKAASWKEISRLCNRRIGSLEELARGEFPKELESLFTDRGCGLFPSPGEIHFECSCPDYAYMCKHVAAALYGIGARLDRDPLLFFEMRGVDSGELLKKTVEDRLDQMLRNAGKKSSRVIAEEEVHRIFGI